MSPTLIQMDSASHRSSMGQVVKTTAAEPRARMVSPRDPVDIFIALDDDNSCETYFCSRDTCPSVRSVLPEASEVFREALGKLKIEVSEAAEKPSEKNAGTTSSISAPTTACARAKTPSPLKTNTMPNILLPSPTTCRSTDISSNKLLKPQKAPSCRRPASFGGADLVKPRTARRASHCEKRVTWADEKGADHQLISVRLIRPRLSADTNLATNSSPGQSILRNTGT